MSQSSSGGKAKRLTAQRQTWLRRRQAVEPTIGHLKTDHRMERCRLKGTEGDALQRVLCAAGLNIRSSPRSLSARNDVLSPQVPWDGVPWLEVVAQN